MKLMPVFLVLASSVAFAQSIPTDFPEGATTFGTDALKSAVSGKVFTVKAAKGPNWRWQFNPDGFFYINVGSFSDSGKWSTKESALCSEGRQIKYSCNEVRAHGADLYLKRDSGEVVRMTAQ